MRLDDYVTQVHDQLAAAAALGDERTQQVARALVGTADSAVRLAVLAALGDAAAEITAALLDSPGAPAVSVRLDGGELQLDVHEAAPEPAQATTARADEGDASARISLRLPESLKADVEQAATGAGVSVNTWLVRAAEAALAPPWAQWTRGGFGSTGRAGDARRGGNAQRVTGWING
jgi:uncharacterized protein (DUF1778 family)